MVSVQLPDVRRENSTLPSARAHAPRSKVAPDITEPPPTEEGRSRSTARLHALFRFWSLGSAGSGTTSRITTGTALSFSGAAAAIALLSFLFVLQVWGIFHSPYYGPFSLVEESAYTYTSSRNFLRFGVLNSGLLQDFCNSQDPSDHPFVYDHMPAGPDLLVALLLNVTGESYEAVRIILAVCFFVGIGFYLRFCQLILAKLSLRGSGFILLLIGPWALVQGFERLIYNLYPFLAFAPFVFLTKYYTTGKKGFLRAAALVAFVSSIYLEYSLLSAVLASWIACYLTGLIRIERRHLFLILACIVSGIALHLLQNMLYLGPTLFFEELTMTLGNRIMGVPTQQELAEFYGGIGLVHHGSQSPRGGVLWTVICTNFRLAMGWKPFVVVAGLGLLFCLRLRRQEPNAWKVVLNGPGRRALGFFFRVALATVAIIITPIMLFPAFAQEVNLHGSGANFYYLSIGYYALAAFGLRQLLGRFPIRVRAGQGKGITVHVRHSFHMIRALRQTGLAGPKGGAGGGAPQDQSPAEVALEGVARGALRLALVVALIVGAVGLGKRAYAFEKSQVDYTLGRWRENAYADLRHLEHFANELYITNINTPAVGFFTNSPGYGVCGPDTITADGRIDRSKCKIAFMRNREVYDQQVPRYFFFFWAREMFPGFAEALPTGTLIGEERGGDALIKRMQDRLDKHFVMVHENRLFRVYDLHQRNTPLDPELTLEGNAECRR